jgi:hypothetical protein
MAHEQDRAHGSSSPLIKLRALPRLSVAESLWRRFHE